MKEFAIYIRQGEGVPYIVSTYNNLFDVKEALYNMISLEEKRQRPYFVDNDFFNNIYTYQCKLKYFKVIVRDVTDWEKYTDKLEEKESSNLIYFKDFKNVLTK